MARSDAKLKTLPEDIQAEMWRMRTTPVDADGSPCKPSEGAPMTQAEVLEWLEDVHRVHSSAGAFSAWESWYGTQRTVGNTKQQTLDLMEALRSKHPEASEEEILEMGQMWFSLRSMETGDAKIFEKMYRLRLLRKSSEMDSRKLALLEAKAKRLDELESKAKALRSGGGLTPETLEMLEKQLKLL
jgi:hypothetical protein